MNTEHLSNLRVTRHLPGWTWDYDIPAWHGRNHASCRNGPVSGLYVSYLDHGWERAYWPTRVAALTDMIYGGFLQFGYGLGTPYAIDVEAGESLCRDCAAKELFAAFEESDSIQSPLIGTWTDGDSGMEGSLDCCNCYEEIHPWTDAESFDELDLDHEHGVFYGDNGYQFLHGETLAKLVVKDEAEKVGLKRYKWKGTTFERR